VGVLLWLGARRKLQTGSIVLCYLGMYAFGRFLLELIRTDTTFRLLGLSRNAWVSLAVVVGAGVWLYLRERRGPAPATATASEPPDREAEGPETAESADVPDGSDAPRDQAEPEPKAADQEQEPEAPDRQPAGQPRPEA
jgi:Prolipoprotein diacylglyceryl transferase